MTYREILKPQLEIDEGRRKKPYRDTVGKLTIGVGRNLDANGLRDSEIDFMLENDMAEAERIARDLVHNFDDLSDVRKAVVCNMALNLGKNRLAGFTWMLKAVNEGRFEDAATEMLNSAWRMQVKDRAVRLAAQMKGET